MTTRTLVLHPGDAGYRFWWQALQDQTDLTARLLASEAAVR